MIATAPLIVACPACGTERQVSERNARAIRGGQRSGLCWACRRIGPDEQLRRWWLQLAGVPPGDIARAGGAEQWVRTHGLPSDLTPLVGWMR